MIRWVAAAVLGLIVGGAAVRAQGLGPDYGHDTMASPATAAEAERLARDAGLDETGVRAARSLVATFHDSMAVLNRRSERAIERMYLVNGSRSHEDIERAVQQASDRRQKAHDEAGRRLLADLRALVPAGREDAWSAFERRVRRRTLLHLSGRVGVGVNLIEVAERAKLDTIPGVPELLSSYEVDLDRMIRSRAALLTRYRERMGNGEERNDPVAAERSYIELRDADCGLLHLQRDTGRKLLALAPPEDLGKVRDMLLMARSPGGVDVNPPVHDRAQKLIKSGRLTGEGLETLERALKRFDDLSRPMDEKFLTLTEDAECGLTFTQAMQGHGRPDTREWFDESRRIQADLQLVIDRVATEDDLDYIERMPGHESPTEEP